MKKWYWIFFFLVPAAAASVYYYIPATLNVAEAVTVNTTPEGAFRCLSDPGNWQKWWPGGSNQDDPLTDTRVRSFNYNGDSYTITRTMRNAFDIRVDGIHAHTATRLMLFPLPGHAVLIKWECSIASGLSPFHRIRSYRQAVALKKNMQAIMARLQRFLSDSKNIYGLALRESGVPDTLLIATKSTVPDYPSTVIIYDLVKRLNQYCKANGATITGPPMLNITALYPVNYQVMVALPVNRELKGNARIFPRKMVPGSFISAEVTGGPHAVEEAYRQIHFYFQDFERTSMAIPFAYLVTDRMREPDTAKWVTKIYAPVY